MLVTMKKIFIIISLVIFVSCNNQVRPDNGHEYDFELMQPYASKHSVDCSKCKEIRKAEIKAYVDSVLKVKGL